jgi:hypothetical protein
MQRSNFNFLEQKSRVMSEIIVEDVKIPLPSGGHLWGKWWGARNVRPFVCVHGYLDNAGSFDRLIPLLPRECSYFAIDLPGELFSNPKRLEMKSHSEFFKI